jgi:hypothetical protein
MVGIKNPDQAVGEAVNQVMFRERMTRKALGEVLGLGGPVAGRKLRGDVGWSLEDLYKVAAYFKIDVSDLLPQGNLDTGFEPATVRINKDG